MHAPRKRIDWLFEQYGGPGVADARAFVAEVNRSYYGFWSDSYGDRFTGDIQREYKELVRTLRPMLSGRVIVNLGGGQGFEFDQFVRLEIDWTRYVYVDPSEAMTAAFRNRVDVEQKPVEILCGNLEDLLDRLAQYEQKVVVMNSSLHHVVWMDSFLAALRELMKPADILVLGHEPRNEYGSSFWLPLGLAVRALSSDFALRKLRLRRSSVANHQRSLWKAVNDDLLIRGVTRQELAPIVLRRLIDYGVGVKGDWRLLRVPPSWDEGQWTLHDIVEELGPDFKVIYRSTYRHFGDSGGRRALSGLNRLAARLWPQSGSQMCAVVKRTTGTVPPPLKSKRDRSLLRRGSRS